MRKFIKRLLRSCLGIVAINQNHYLVRYIHHPSFTPFDEVLLRSFPKLDGLSFVQIGANDGKRFDPISPLIKHYSWHGVMVEPDPTYFAALQQLYGKKPRLKLLNAALAASCGEMPLYVIGPDIPNLPDWTQGLGSLKRERLLTAAKDLGLSEDAIAQKTVKTITWNEVFIALGGKTPDVLVLDTEGYDLILLRLAELSKHRPKVILFEHSCVTPSERLSFYGDLIGLGYEIRSVGTDTIAHFP